MGAEASLLSRLRAGDLSLSQIRLPPGSPARGSALRWRPVTAKDTNGDPEPNLAGRCRTSPASHSARPSPEVLLRDASEAVASNLSALRQPRRALLRSVQEVLGRPDATRLRLRGLPHYFGRQSPPEDDRTRAEIQTPAQANLALILSTRTPLGA